MKRIKKVAAGALAILLSVVSSGILPPAAHAAFPGQNGMLAFGSIDLDAGQMTLATANLDGSNKQTIASAAGGSDVIVGAPRWSADSRKLTYTKGDMTNGFNIFVVNPDGTDLYNVTNFTDDSDRSGLYSSFHPSGSTIAYGESWFEGNDPDEPRSRIVTNNLLGTNLQALTTASATTCDANPLFSPDGSKIAFWRSDTTTETAGLYLMNADGSDQTELAQMAASGVTNSDCLADLNGTYPTPFATSLHGATPFDWSPDGTHLVFSRLLQNPSGGTSEVVLVDLDGNETSVLSSPYAGPGDADPGDSPISLGGNIYNNPAFTPEGQIIVKHTEVTLTAQWDPDQDDWEINDLPEYVRITLERLDLDGSILDTIYEHTWQTGDDLSAFGPFQYIALYGYALPSVQPLRANQGSSGDLPAGSASYLAATGSSITLPVLLAVLMAASAVTVLTRRLSWHR